MIHVMSYEELLSALLAYLFDLDTYDDGGNQ
jgi:hypothetical protein